MGTGRPLTSRGRSRSRRGGGGRGSVSACPAAAAAPCPGCPSAMSRHSSQDENLQGSWVELHFSSNGNGSTATPTGQEQVPASISIHNGDMEKILLDAQHESGRSSSRESSHCDSPPRSQTPQDSHRALELESHSSGEKNSFQWLGSHVPLSQHKLEAPPFRSYKEFLFKHPRRTATLSMRNTSVMKKGGIFSAEFLKVFLPSLLLSHLLAIGLGVYIGRRLTTTASSSTF
ncbi:Bnip3 [Columba livia]|nr:Bnip3 [Columba livia]